MALAAPGNATATAAALEASLGRSDASYAMVCKEGGNGSMVPPKERVLSPKKILLSQTLHV